MEEGGRSGSETPSQVGEGIASPFSLASTTSHGHISHKRDQKIWHLPRKPHLSCNSMTMEKRRETDFNEQMPDSGQRIRQDDRGLGPYGTLRVHTLLMTFTFLVFERKIHPFLCC